MARLIDIPAAQLFPMIRVLSDAGGNTADAAWMRRDDNAKELIEFIRSRRKMDPTERFALMSREIVQRFAAASHHEMWGFGENVFDKLRATAPQQWEEGYASFLSLRIRFGTSDEGVQETYERHAKCIARVLGEGQFNNVVPPDARPHLRMGNALHVPVVEWVVLEMGAHRKRESLGKARREASIADEGLVFAWLYPEYMKAMDDLHVPGYHMAGYSLQRDATNYSLSLDTHADQVRLGCAGDHNASPGMSVPTARPLG